MFRIPLKTRPIFAIASMHGKKKEVPLGTSLESVADLEESIAAAQSAVMTTKIGFRLHISVETTAGSRSESVDTPSILFRRQAKS